MPRILYYDIEWKPAKAYIWRAWDENVGPDQMIDAGGLLCFSAVWGDTKELIFSSEWEDGHDGMVRKLHTLLMEADVLITYNGDRYDIPKAMGEFLLAGLAPPPQPTSIDLMKAVKKMGFIMNRLAFIGPYLQIGKKIKHEGFPLWTAVMNGDERAQNRMKRYCIQDTKLLLRLYKKIRPFIRNHPRLKAGEFCPACQSDKTQKRGFRYTRFFQIQRNQCTGCGHWFETTRKKVT